MIYADTNIFIRLLEGDADSRAAIEARIRPLRSTFPIFITSRLTQLECRVKPIRQNNQTLLAQYNSLFCQQRSAVD